MVDYPTANSDQEETVSADIDAIEDGQSGTFDEESEDSDFANQSLRELDRIERKGKGKQANRHTLEVRRAIEEHLEAKKLRKELDYLLDEHFSDENEDQDEDKK